MIPIDHKQSIVNTGIDFIRSITDCYGAEVGMALWDQIAQTLDPSIKGEIFFAMLCGHSAKRMTISGVVVDRVRAIKAIREVTMLGLKEAKDLSDAMQAGGKVSVELHSGIERGAAAHTLRTVGITVH